jgi:two-component system cell cycle response regulator
MKVYLKSSQNGKWPKLMALTGDAVIGRSDNCNLRIASRAVSRKHCRIRLHKHGVYVTDLGSTNGTLVNNSILESAKRRQLRDRDQITIGPMSFVLRIKASPEPAADDELLRVTRSVPVLRPEDLA